MNTIKQLKLKNIYVTLPHNIPITSKTNHEFKFYSMHKHNQISQKYNNMSCLFYEMFEKKIPSI